jgi:internalin A
VKHRLTWLAVILTGTLQAGCGADPVPQGPAPASDPRPEGSPVVETAKYQTVPQPDSARPAASDDRRVSTPDQLIEALVRKNPGLDQANMGMRPMSADLLEMGINDPSLKDISPLRKQRIAILDLRFCDVTDLSPLEGMPISQLYLEENRRLSDLGPLRGMPLHKLYLENTAVENLAPLRGAPLMELNAIGTRVKDLSPLVESPLQMLWLSECPVTDLSPLNKVALVSLTVENTPVADISPLAGTALQRLHIGGTKVTDLTPVGQMQLNRLIFTPHRIERGLDVVRNSRSIREIGVDFDHRLPPHEFWRLFDEGQLNP